MKPTRKELDDLWSKAVKLRDGNKSVWSGKTERLNAHHVLKKGTFRLRWELDNGITITCGEHKFIAHGGGKRADEFKKWALKRFSAKRRKELEQMNYQIGGTDLWAVKLYLIQKIAEFSKSKNCIEGCKL